ncbi:MAG: AI-2E family transporter [Gammaproteobacteria bacterium]
MSSPVQASHSLRVFLAIVIAVAVLRYAQDVFVPLALAILLTFLLAPLVDRLQGLHLNRTLAVILCVALTMFVLGGLLWVVFHQFTDLANQLPSYRRQLRANLAGVTGALKGGVASTAEALDQLTREFGRVAPVDHSLANVPKMQVVEPALTPMRAVTSLVAPFIKPLGTSALVIVFVIFMLLRLPDLRDRIIGLLGSKNLRVTTEALDEAAHKVSRYLVMQTVINGMQGVGTAVGLYCIGMPNAILWGALTMALRFVPYIGIWVAAALPIALSFAIFDHWSQPALVAALFLSLEGVSNLILEPWLYGSRTGVSPIALLVAAAFWTWLWGPIGLLLAIPMTVCLVVMGKYIPQLAFLYTLLGDQPVLEPHERLYQRLLASNRDEADELLEESVRTKSRGEVCDSVIVPALQLAEDDHDRGALPDAKRQVVFAHIEQWADEFIAVREVPRAPPGNPTSAVFGATVLCIAAEDQADAISSKLLASLLLEQGIKARAPHNGLEEEPRPDAVVISALPPDAVTAARRCCRAVRQRWHDVPILVGLWNAHGRAERSRQRLEAVGATGICTSFAEGIAMLEIRFAAAKRAPARATLESAPAESA